MTAELTAPDAAPGTFRAVWPIRDDQPVTVLTYAGLIRDANRELPQLLARAGARATGEGTYRIALSSTVPGSGNVTDAVLVYDCPAEPVPARPYRQRLRSVR